MRRSSAVGRERVLDLRSPARSRPSRGRSPARTSRAGCGTGRRSRPACPRVVAGLVPRSAVSGNAWKSHGGPAVPDRRSCRVSRHQPVGRGRHSTTLAQSACNHDALRVSKCRWTSSPRTPASGTSASRWPNACGPRSSSELVGQAHLVGARAHPVEPGAGARHPVIDPVGPARAAARPRSRACSARRSRPS